MNPEWFIYANGDFYDGPFVGPQAVVVEVPCVEGEQTELAIPLYCNGVHVCDYGFLF